jgi:phosphoribosylformylglycinamidine synthase subunit PurL
VSCKDLGAGGIVCATVEQVAPINLGADIELTNVETSIPDLPPEIIACAETQERMCWICHPDITSSIIKHYNETWDLPGVSTGAKASIIGKVTDNGMYRLRFNRKTVCNIKSIDMTCAVEINRTTISHHINTGLEKQKTLSDLNDAPKDTIFLNFDKTVIGNTVVEPGEAPASVIMPLQDQGIYTGVVIGCGGPLVADPYKQGRGSASDAIAKIEAFGAKPRAITDCLNYGNPEIPEHLWDLEQGVRGIADAAKQSDIPVISGNVSLYNCNADGNAIPPSATCCAIGIINDAIPIQKHYSHKRLLAKKHIKKEDEDRKDRLRLAIFGSI